MTTDPFEKRCLDKEEELRALLQEYPSIAIGFSGGVDSAYLCEMAHEVLAEKAAMIIADSPSIPRSELAEAKELAAERKWNLTIINTEEFENESYLANDGTRFGAAQANEIEVGAKHIPRNPGLWRAEYFPGLVELPQQGQDVGLHAEAKGRGFSNRIGFSYACQRLQSLTGVHQHVGHVHAHLCMQRVQRDHAVERIHCF